jgi:asparagine N-glycosylation enzyme membrane subunit Stt3
VSTFFEIVGIVVVSVITVIVFGLLFGMLEAWLWNQVMPDMFGFKEMTYWQAVCISWLCGLWFKNGTTSKSSS